MSHKVAILQNKVPGKLEIETQGSHMVDYSLIWETCLGFRV